jgi:hypothetical protein
MWFHDCEFDEKQRQHRKNQRLNYTHKHLKCHKRHWKKIWKEEAGNQNHHLTGKNVSEKTE